VLEGAFFAVSQLNSDNLGARGWGYAFISIQIVGICRIVISISWLTNPLRGNADGFLRFTVPFRVVKVFVGFDKIIDGEVVFSIK
jgi:hypothetical protein